MFHGFSRILGPGALAKRQLENPQQDDRPEIHPWNFTETLLLLSRQCGNGMIVNSNYGSFPHFPHFLLSTVRKSQGKASFLKWAWAWWDNVEYIQLKVEPLSSFRVSRGLFMRSWWFIQPVVAHWHIDSPSIPHLCSLHPHFLPRKQACLSESVQQDLGRLTGWRRWFRWFQLTKTQCQMEGAIKGMWGTNEVTKSRDYSWLVVGPPLWKIWVRQLGWLATQY